MSGVVDFCAAFQIQRTVIQKCKPVLVWQLALTSLSQLLFKDWPCPAVWRRGQLPLIWNWNSLSNRIGYWSTTSRGRLWIWHPKYCCLLRNHLCLLTSSVVPVAWIWKEDQWTGKTAEWIWTQDHTVGAKIQWLL